MNVYDFDKTVFYPDSSVCFFLFCMRRFPGKVLPVLPGAMIKAVKYRKGSQSAKDLKQHLFSFLGNISDSGSLVSAFWKAHASGVASWYLLQKKPDDVIISASPDFLLRPLCDTLGVFLIATDMDPCSGQIRGENCHDVEKPVRFFQQFPDARIDAFYSDSLSDTPMAKLADRAFLVKKNRLFPWPQT